MGLQSVFVIFSSLCLVIPALAQEIQSPTALRMEINQPLQIQTGHHYWEGPRDSSLFLDVQLQGKNLIITGSLYDDYPFIQPRVNPINIESKVVEYGADGVRFLLRSQEDDSKIYSDLYLNFGSLALNPKVVTAMGKTNVTHELAGSRLKFLQLKSQSRFFISLPLSLLFESPESLKSSELEVRLYDLDRDHKEYTMLRDRIVLSDLMEASEVNSL